MTDRATIIDDFGKYLDEIKLEKINEHDSFVENKIIAKLKKEITSAVYKKIRGLFADALNEAWPINHNYNDVIHYFVNNLSTIGLEEDKVEDE